MGSYATPPQWSDESANDTDEDSRRLGDVLSGRLSDADLDSVEAVRDEREQE